MREWVGEWDSGGVAAGPRGVPVRGEALEVWVPAGRGKGGKCGRVGSEREDVWGGVGGETRDHGGLTQGEGEEAQDCAMPGWRQRSGAGARQGPGRGTPPEHLSSGESSTLRNILCGHSAPAATKGGAKGGGAYVILEFHGPHSSNVGAPRRAAGGLVTPRGPSR